MTPEPSRRRRAAEATMRGQPAYARFGAPHGAWRAERRQDLAERGRGLRALQQRTIDTRRKIIEAAVQEFAERGYDGASTRVIAENAGAQHQLITYHFGGKEGLWRAVIVDLVAEHKAHHDEYMRELGDVDPVQKLRRIQGEFVRFSAERVKYHHIMAHVAQTASPQLRWVIDEYLLDVYGARAELIRAAQAAGKYVPGDPYHLQYLFLGAVTRIFLLAAEVEQVAGRSPLTPEFVAEHEKVCLSLFFRD